MSTSDLFQRADRARLPCNRDRDRSIRFFGSKRAERTGRCGVLPHGLTPQLQSDAGVLLDDGKRTDCAVQKVAPVRPGCHWSHDDHAVRFDPGITRIGGYQLLSASPTRLPVKLTLPCSGTEAAGRQAAGQSSGSLSMPVGICAALAIRITAEGTSHGGRATR
jgi:hypothetical protein